MDWQNEKVKFVKKFTQSIHCFIQKHNKPKPLMQSIGMKALSSAVLNAKLPFMLYFLVFLLSQWK